MNKIRIIITVLLLAVGVNALLAGYSFITDRSGSGLGASVEILHHSPFHDFFIPGIILFGVNGLLNIYAAVCLISNWRYAYLFVAFQGVLLTGWITIQVFMLQQFNILHAIFGSLGLFFFFAGLILYKRIKRIKVTCGFKTGDRIKY